MEAGTGPQGSWVPRIWKNHENDKKCLTSKNHKTTTIFRLKHNPLSSNSMWYCFSPKLLKGQAQSIHQHLARSAVWTQIYLASLLLGVVYSDLVPNMIPHHSLMITCFETLPTLRGAANLLQLCCNRAATDICSTVAAARLHGWSRWLCECSTQAVSVPNCFYTS
mgnify:CR=1 FL=1